MTGDRSREPRLDVSLAEELGEHNEEILEQLGFSAGEIEGFRASRTIPGRQIAEALTIRGSRGATPLRLEKRKEMAMFQTLIHPTDFDEPSKEAFRVARSIAQSLGASIVVFHVVSPPAIVVQNGRVIQNPHDAEPTDLWAEYRTLQADTPDVPVQYAVVVGDKSESKHMLEEKIREAGEGVLVVMGSHGHRGISRLLWGSTAEQVVQDCPCPVLVVKATASPKLPVWAPEVEVPTHTPDFTNIK
jgi:nucleotide-binding universal stress UspA family protein